MVAVGYNSDITNPTPYWILRNSFGPGWGDKGFIWVTQNSDNPEKGYCGVNTNVIYPKLGDIETIDNLKTSESEGEIPTENRR